MGHFRRLFSYLFRRQPSMKDLTQEERELASRRKTSVDDFLASLSRYVRELDNPDEWLAQHKVSKISLRKCRSPPEHELIVANVAFPVSAKDGHNNKPPVDIAYCLERTVAEGKSVDKPAPPVTADTRKSKAGKPTGNRLKSLLQPKLKPQKGPRSANLMEKGSALDSVSSASAASLNSSSSSIPGYKQAADDIISGSLARDIMNENDVVVLGCFRPANMNILHLAVLAKLIRSKSPEYTLFKHQCYWYACCVYATAFLVHGTDNDDDDRAAALSIDTLEEVNAAGEETWADVTKEPWCVVAEEPWVEVPEETVQDASAPQSSGTPSATKRLSSEAGRFMNFKVLKQDARNFCEDYRQAIKEETERVNSLRRLEADLSRKEAETEELKAQIRAMEHQLQAQVVAPVRG